ncbi:uncharacterized protein LOC125756773, partial [Rhipicephalus sanguineus]|uniref:uncharacterized protein LOC125756773 n=1 Tax=Rhipicephalus sanguineus TaxID=34632 RepID=UPI0020C3CDCB
MAEAEESDWAKAAHLFFSGARSGAAAAARHWAGPYTAQLINLFVAAGRLRPAAVKCQDFNLTNNLKKLRSYDKGSSIRIEYVLYNRCSRGNIQIEGKKVTATPGHSFSKLVLSSVGMGSKLTIGSNSTFLCFNKGGRLVNK